MDIKQYLKTFDGLKTENSWQRVSILVLSLVVGGEAFLLSTNPTIVTVQPWTLSTSAQITETQASQNYVEAWGLALAELLGNVTPGTVEFVGERLKPLLHPSIYHNVMDGLHANVEDIRDDRISMRFEPRLVNFEKSTGHVFVTGRSFVRHGDSLEKEFSSERTYEFGIRISHYAPVITHINTYEGKAQTVDEKNRKRAHEMKKHEKEKKQQQKERGRYMESADLTVVAEQTLSE